MRLEGVVQSLVEICVGMHGKSNTRLCFCSELIWFPDDDVLLFTETLVALS